MREREGARVPPPPGNKFRDEKEAIMVDTGEIQEIIMIYL